MKNKFTLLCGKYDFEIPKAVSKIVSYYEENPQYLLYDLDITTKQQKWSYYKFYISKASVLKLQHIKSEAWVKLEKKLEKAQSPTTMSIKEITELEQEIDGIGKATLTKVFHLLQPSIVPLVDSKIEGAVKETKCFEQNKRSKGNALLAICEIICADVVKNNDSLVEICRQINKEYRDIKITPLRAWDILVWSIIKNKGVTK